MTTTSKKNGSASKLATVVNQKYVALHALPDSEMNKSLAHITKVPKFHLLTPGTEEEESNDTVIDAAKTTLPVEVYKLQSILFNGAVTVTDGVAAFGKDEYQHQLNNFFKLCDFLRWFSVSDLNAFMETFEFALDNFIQNNPAEANDRNQSNMRQLQQLIRLILLMGDEPYKIIQDMHAIHNSVQFGITKNPAK